MTSIWLRPEGRQDERLQELIDRLAEEHGTVTFAPHLTVCGVAGDLAVLDVPIPSERVLRRNRSAHRAADGSTHRVIPAAYPRRLCRERSSPCVEVTPCGRWCGRRSAEQGNRSGEVTVSVKVARSHLPVMAAI
jgi:hypothetical protein